MQSDYFRLCFILVEGGFYVDTDDVYGGAQIGSLFDDSRLKIQPLVYDTTTHTMVAPLLFMQPELCNSSWIFYFNNNPLIAGKDHPLVRHALIQATTYLEKIPINTLPEIQSTTGPGNLTKSIFDAAKENEDFKHSLMVLSDWESISTSRWELSYRNDPRNWRISNCQSYRE